jgi:hypothetical protein
VAIHMHYDLSGKLVSKVSERPYHPSRSSPFLVHLERSWPVSL